MSIIASQQEADENIIKMASAHTYHILYADVRQAGSVGSIVRGWVITAA